jgi:hypothetical protein
VRIRITRSVHFEQARSFGFYVNDFSGVADPVFTLMRGSGLQGQFTCEQARSFCSSVNNFSGVADPIFMLMRGSGLQGQFTLSKQGLSAPVLMISPVFQIPFLC